MKNNAAASSAHGVLIGALVLSVVGTATGFLPGTKKPSK